uniref:Uncharacterized protein n=2 Tax=Anguilla anguilla TaxID=7936 RepID=A0A0E9TKT5_ANGAN
MSSSHSSTTAHFPRLFPPKSYMRLVCSRSQVTV